MNTKRIKVNDDNLRPTRRRFFEFSYWGNVGHNPIGRIGREQRWVGPFLRLGNLRFKVERKTQRYKATGVPDRVRWEFSFYYDRRKNTFEGDRTIWPRKSALAPVDALLGEHEGTNQ